MERVILLWLLATINLTWGFQTRGVELVYDTEAADLPDSVPKYASISGCFFMCVSGKCILLDKETENMCMMIAIVIENKQGNFREGHFNAEYYSRLPDDRDNATCVSQEYGTRSTDLGSDFDSAVNGPITGYQVWTRQQNPPYVTGIRIRYGNVWGKAFGVTAGPPACYVQLSASEVITMTSVQHGSLVDGLQLTTSLTQYPFVGSRTGGPGSYTGQSLRYITAAANSNGDMTCLKVHFIC